ncbi:hypothetical protein IAT38_006674 [Cryptococcus sp. DSM 104549]
MSSLANQLQSIASLDASRLTSKYGAPSSKSYLFTPAVASTHDLDSIFALGQSGFEELLALDSEMEAFEGELFSEAAKRTDRMMLTAEENKELDRTLEKCLRRLGKWIGVMAGGKCIEWLVRRFRVHELNAEALLQVFLPYHESPNFPRILAILTLPPSSPYFVPFAPLIKSAQPIPRSYIVTAISPAKDRSLQLVTGVAGLVQQAVQEGVVHRALLAFWSAVMVELLEAGKRGKGVEEGLVKVLVEAFVTVLSLPRGGEDVNAAVYPPLVLLTRSVNLADAPFRALAEALLTPGTLANPSQRMLTLLVILNDRAATSSSTGPADLGEHATVHLAKVKQLGEILVAAMEKYGFERAVAIIVGAMLAQPELHAKSLATVLEHRALPTSTAQLAATALLQLGSAPNTSSEAKAACKALLANLRERHPTTVDSAFLSASALPETTLDSALIHKPASELAFVDVYSADVSSRVEGVREVLRLAKEGEEGESAVAALVARLADEDLPVIEALYSEPEELLQVLSVDKYISGVKPLFWSASPSSNLVGLHLNFISSYLLSPASTKAHPEVGQKVFREVLFPCFLSTEKRQPFTKAEAVKLLGGGFKGVEMLKGIVPEIARARAEDAKGGAQRSNLVIARALAEATSASSTFPSDLTFLLTNLTSPHPPARLLSHLVLHTLILTLRGDKQLTTALAVLSHLAERQEGAAMRDVKVGNEQVGGEYLEAVYKRPGEGRTTHRAVVGLLAAMVKVGKPEGEKVVWLSDEASNETSNFKSFAQQIYTWTNTALLPASLSQTLLRALFTQLSEDALLFFASIFTAPQAHFPALRTAALRHAGAFVRAYAGAKPQGSKDQAVDFQVMLPVVLVALQDEEREVRKAAVEVLKAVGKEVEGSAGIYALDSVYGARSDTVQLLKSADKKKYVDALLEVADEFALDAGRVRALHTEVLGMQSGKNRKESAHRRAIIGYLLSHITAHRSTTSRLALLNLLSDVHDTSVLRGAIPLLSALADDADEESAWLAAVQEGKREEYLGKLWGALGVESVQVLGEQGSAGWALLLSLLDAGKTSRFHGKLRELSLERMLDGVFTALSPTQKIEYTVALIESLRVLPTDDALATNKVLEKLEMEPAVLIELIEVLSEPLEMSMNRKRQKQDTAEDDKPTQAVMDLTILIDSRTWRDLPGDASLVASLMTILSALLAKRLVIKEGVDYLEQEVLGAILALVEKIQEAGEVLRAHVGIEVVVKVIRASSNPRTAQRALLVASELARLIPDAVLHNVMPIFTFMGASDFQRDDAYTFGVVEKTVSRIVPVMTKSLKEKASSSLELYNESLTFLSIFTDMAGRLPRHRTLPFFVHLVKSLGPADFLPAVCMLLVDRATTKAGRSSNSVATVLELPAGLAAAFDVSVRTEVLVEVVQELGRLVGDLSKTEKEAFLSQTISDNDAADRPLRQITHLITFLASLIAQLRGKPCAQASIQTAVRQLIVLAAATSQPVMASTDIPANMHAALASSMLLLSADNFLSVTLELLADGSSQDVVMCLGVFAERLPLIKSEVRTKCTKTIGEIVKKVAGLLVAPTSGAGVAAALEALKVVVETAVTAEDGALAGAVPVVVKSVGKMKDAAGTVKVLALVELLVRHLASRTIPYIQSIVETSLALIKSPKSTATSAKQAFSTLSSIIEVVSAFVSSKQLIAVLLATLDYRASDEAVALTMCTTIAKRIRTKALFPVLMDLWKTVQEQGDESGMKGFFEMLRLTLRNAAREDLPGMIKPVFAFFLDVFDLRHRLQIKGVDAETIDAVEQSAIGSFLELVTKLNEVTFKPLFIRLYDWAVIDLAEGKAVDDGRLIERKIVLLHVMMGLLTKFRNLLSPYIGTLLPHIHELLPVFASGSLRSFPLWTLLLNVLSKSFEVDAGAFWTDALQIELLPGLVSQIPLFLSAPSPRPISECLASLAGSTTSETVLRRLNTSICLATRADEPKARLAALDALGAVWSAQAEEMVGLVPETVSEFLAELLEDESKDVEGAARGVLAKIEKVTGSLKEYLE